MRALEEFATPLLERLATGVTPTAAERTEYALAEAQLRDGLRAGVLMVPEVVAAARAARERGVEVVLLDDSAGAKWTTVADLTTADGRIIPSWMAQAVVKRGMKDERWQVIEILYGTAALADLPPVKLIALELEVPERTASDWIQKARAGGWLVGMTSNVGRPANG